MKRSIITLFLCVLLHTATAQTKDAGTAIVVQLNGIKAPTGQVLLSLFNDADGFPTQPEKAYRWAKKAVTSSSLIISLDGLPPGKYAIAVVHDENGNEVMDTNWMGLPEEEYGISNNVTGTLMPPTFDEASFTVTGRRDTLKIEMHP